MPVGVPGVSEDSIARSMMEGIDSSMSVLCSSVRLFAAARALNSSACFSKART